MTFKKEISIDGVAVIVATIGLVAWLVTQKNHLDQLTSVVGEHAQILKEDQTIINNIEMRNQITDSLEKESEDHESRIRTLEKDADFLKIAH